MVDIEFSSKDESSKFIRLTRSPSSTGDYLSSNPTDYERQAFGMRSDSGFFNALEDRTSAHRDER